ncbi:hypothetical protein LSH36_29g08016 [Paralvinella palmiformis]|uniref:Cytosol aminopeptidase domain-containing protein n=1 Tax=Paralvinella palmiformis TaxID=53620 RepID=A0AAD9NES7_9ANNE|nr:hypothetical protein LSH36_29g08016 [Paralvinella palmiformis]
MVKLAISNNVTDAGFDGVVVVTNGPESLSPKFELLKSALIDYKKIDDSDEVAVIVCDKLPSKRLEQFKNEESTKTTVNYYRLSFKSVDVLWYYIALSSGCQSPLLVCSTHDLYPLAVRVACLGALHALYTPLEIREDLPSKKTKVNQLGLFGIDDAELKILQAIETGRIVYRDIGGSDPERMAAPRVADYVVDIFTGTCIKVEVISELAILEKKYPLLVAVNRAARNVKRHNARVIRLEYEGEGPIKQTLMLVGKGVTYDTGGADIKAGGVMAGMHRDKCGAAFVAGLFQTLSILKPKGLKVIGAMSMVRNSVGSECYVADELIVSRAGVRIRIGNTDAEGRMAMSDVVCEMKELAVGEVNPCLFTIATLTGHVIRAYGANYTAVVSNHPAVSSKVSQTLFEAGEKSGDPFEISTLRREDFALHKGKSEYEDLIQSNNKPSTLTDRGHQTPAAFIIMASGLDKHGRDSSAPLPYAHLDIAGSSGPFPGVPTGSPIVAFTHAYVLDRK